MPEKAARTGGARFMWAALFITITLVILAGGCWHYQGEAARIRREKYREIATIAAMKAGQIVQWRKERLADSWRAANGPTVIKILAEITRNPNASALREELRRILEVNRKGGLYANVLLIAPDGKVLLAAKEGTDSADPVTRQVIAAALASPQSVVSDFFRASDGFVHIDAAAAVPDAEGRPLAVMILRVNAEEVLFPMIQAWPTPSRSAETVLIRRQGEELLYLNELRHRSKTALSMREPLTLTNLPAVQAVLGRQGLFQGRDYRGEEVLADLRMVPGLPWFMVAKVDAREALAEVRYRAVGIAVVVVLLILLTAAVTAFAYRQQQAGYFRGLYESERQKREAQAALRTTLYSIGDGVIATDIGGGVREMNPVAEGLTGWSRADAQGKPLEEVFRIVNEATRAKIDNPVQRVLRKGSVVGLANHTLLMSRDGAERPIAYSAAPIRDESGGIIGVVLVFRDQTEERAALRQLRESEERFRLMVESVEDYAILMLDPGGRVVSWNAGAERLEGYRAEDIIGRHFALFYPEEEGAHGKPAHALETAAAEGRFEEEGWRVRRDGSRFIANVIMTAVRDDTGRLRGFVKVTRDITERRQAVEALRKLNAELEQRVEERTRELRMAKEAAEAANRAKSEFLANVSHEVRTPMNAIMGMTDLVLETALTGEQKRFLTTVRESADSLLRVLNDILDFAKIEAGRLDLEETPFALREVVEGTAAALAERAHSKGLELACHLPAEVPDSLVGDPGRLRQVLVNLIGNAIKFSSRGEVVVRAAVEAAREHDITLHFSVADTGIGISPEKRKVIFEPFRQADASVTRKFGGTGLGLAIASQLTARMNGRIWVESEVGQGSVFHFTARFVATTGAPPKTPGSPHKKPEEPGVRPLKVLLAEDYPMNRELAVQHLVRRGHAVVVAENGEEAVRRLEEEEFDVVLMDVQMPVMDGYAATAAIRDPKSSVRRHDIPIIAMTAHAMKGDRERCLAAGMNAYVSKPFTAADLMGALGELFGSEQGCAKEAAALSPGAEVFDRAVLLHHVDDDADLARNCVKSYLLDMATRLASLEAAADASDGEAFHRHAHTLKGAAAMLGAHRARTVCQRMEATVRQGDIQAAKAMIAEAKREIGALEQALREFLR